MLDVFLTVLHVQVESPMSNWFNRRFWWALLSVAERLPGRARDDLLGWGAPLMIGGIIAVWAVSYVVGFGLVYLPFIYDPGVFSVDEGSTTTALSDALYFSAVSFFTLGYGDVTPVHPLARLLSLFEGASGLLTITLSATYLLSVYPLISRKAALAASLNLETGGRSDGVVVVQRYVAEGRFEALGERLRQVTDDLLNLEQSHTFYPVLYYVRPRQAYQSFARILAIVQGIVITLRYGLDPVVHRDVVTDPRLLVLEEGLLYTLHALAESSHLTPKGQHGEEQRAAANFIALIDALEAHGVTTVSRHDRAAAEAHTRFRWATDRYIRGYAETVGYEPPAVWATYDRWARNSALVGHADVPSQDVPSQGVPSQDVPSNDGVHA